jgi:glutamine amidotransferase
MITYVPANIDIPWEGIQNGAVFNDDGHGWAVASKQGIEVGKSMDFDIAALTLAVAREKHGPDSLVMFHSRFATHGQKTTFNVHPFWVGEGEETVMAHNGILPAEWHPHHGDRRSDTRVFGDRTASRYVDNGVPSRRGGKAMGTMIGNGNKLVFLTAKNGQPKVRIVNAHMGVFTDGVWYSNDGYKPTYWGSGYGGTSRWDDDYAYFPKDGSTSSSTGTSASFEDSDGADLPSGKESCRWCGGSNIDVASDICLMCEVCLSCNEWMGDCDCYLSESERYGKDVREAAQTKGKDVELWTPTGSPLNPTFKPAEVGIEV